MGLRAAVAVGLLVATTSVSTIALAEATARPGHVQLTPGDRRAFAAHSMYSLLGGSYFAYLTATHSLTASIFAGTAALTVGTVLTGAGLAIIGGLSVWTLVRATRGIWFARKGYFPANPGFWDKGPFDYLSSATVRGSNTPRGAPTRVPADRSGAPTVSTTGAAGVAR